MSVQPERTLGERLKGLLSVVPNLVAATSFGVLMLAFVHEWAFYYTVGGQYQTLLGITDYFNSAISWLPWFALGFITTSIFMLTDPMSEVPRDVKNEFYKTNRTRWVLDNFPVWSVILLGLTVGTIQFLFGDWYTRGFLEMLFMVVWAKILAAILKRPSVKEWITRDIVYLILFVPVFLVMAYVTGMTEAADFLDQKKKPNAIGRLKNQYQEREWIVLRSLTSGVLVRDLSSQDRLRFIRWDDVAGFETKLVQPNRNGLVCRVSGYLCRS